jgi:hypothetical protein
MLSRFSNFMAEIGLYLLILMHKMLLKKTGQFFMAAYKVNLA